MAAIAVATLVGLFVDVGTLSAQQVLRCDFKTWVGDWVANKKHARELKDALATTVCQFRINNRYCRASSDFKDLVIKQSKAYQFSLAKEAIAARPNPDELKVCLLCQVKDLYRTVVGDPTNSIKALCKTVGDLVASRPDLLYTYREAMHCDFRMSQAALTDEKYDDVFWNKGDESIRGLLERRVIADLKGGAPDDVIKGAMEWVGELLDQFVDRYPPKEQDEDGLTASFNRITCTEMSLPSCQGATVQCP